MVAFQSAKIGLIFSHMFGNTTPDKIRSKPGLMILLITARVTSPSLRLLSYILQTKPNRQMMDKKSTHTDEIAGFCDVKK